MEDLWRIENSGVDVEEVADILEYRHFLERFSIDEEMEHRRRLLYGEQERDKTRKRTED